MARVPVSPVAEVPTRAAGPVFQGGGGATAGAFGAATGIALQRVGADLGVEAERFLALEKRERDENTRRQAKAADLRFSQHVQLALDGDGTPDNPGFRNLRGLDAVGPNLQGVREGFRTEYQNILGEMNDSDARVLFTEAAGTRIVSALSTVAMHASAQQRVVDDELDESRKAQATSDAASDISNLRQSVDVVLSAQADQSRRAGESQEVLEEKLRVAASTVIREAIVAEIKRGNLQSARESFEELKGHIDGAVSAEIEKLLKTTEDLTAAQEAADQASLLFGTDEEAGLAWIRKNFEGTVEKSAVADYSNRVTANGRARQKELDDAESLFSQQLEQGASIASLAQQFPEQMALVQGDPILLTRLEAREKMVAEGRRFASESDGVTFGRLTALPVDNMAATDLFSVRHLLTEVEYNDLVEMKKAAQASVSTTTSTAPYNAAISLLNNMMPESYNSGRKDEIPEVKQLRAKMRVFVSEFKDEHSGRNPTVPEVAEEASRLLLPLVHDPIGLNIFSDEPAFQTLVGLLRGPKGKLLSAEDLQFARLPVENIPPSLFDDIVAELDRRGLEAPDDLIEEIAASQVLNQRARQSKLFGVE